MAALFRQSERQRIAAVMQLPAPPESKRTLWQTACFISVMIAFLIFSDWVNPGTKWLTLCPNSTIYYLDSNNNPQVLSVSRSITLDVSILQQTRGDMTVQIQTSPEEESEQIKNAVTQFVSGTRLNVPLSSVENIADNVPKSYQWACEVHRVRWFLAGLCFISLMVMLWRWFERQEIVDWLLQSWTFAKSIVPLLFGGVFITGFVSTLIPAQTVASWVGGNSIGANVIASLIGSLWYFATLTEIPCMQALLNLGMGKGPALALLLAGPTLSLPSIIVIGKYLGFSKTAAFVLLVIGFSAIIGWSFGAMF